MFGPLKTEFRPEQHNSTQMTSEADRIDCESSEVTHAISKDCHGHNKCKITAEPSQLGAQDCNSKNVFLNITFVCILSEHFNDEFKWKSNKCVKL